MRNSKALKTMRAGGTRAAGGNSERYSMDGDRLTVGNRSFSHTLGGFVRASAGTEDGDGLSVPYLAVRAERQDGAQAEFDIWEDLSAVRMPDFPSGGSALTLEGEHWRIRSVSLHAFTDENDTLVTDTEHFLFQRSLAFPLRGEIFFFENLADGSAAVLLSETPDWQSATVTVKGGAVTLENGGNGVILGFCRTGECEALCRAILRHLRKPTVSVAMSNTWGDCNGFSRVCRDFILREIDAARDIGVDVVQIDDGWQTGSTADQSRRDALGRREFKGDFWDLRYDRFPAGMEEITEYARAADVRLGLWFAPDSHGDFALLERDAAVLEKAWREWGMRCFKLDMFWIHSNTERDRFLSLLKRIYSLGDGVTVQLDVTRNERLNYLCGWKYGTVFVENRYTKTANSFPHRILRNLWMLSRYLPAGRFQFELINPALNTERYDAADPFAPTHYTMDYLFAQVMLSNPLWRSARFTRETTLLNSTKPFTTR